ncbi:hypothetical protein GCM10017781_24890 [Deinococcus metalli]|uniref:Uncharacterized protein n=1 Tax=Deinococcus metalli TaxID=1141878 RepID=A0ABQ3JS67_9DEIO|nr:hypothetical protein GCM10017781_24890 [Deinococcus metalli]
MSPVRTERRASHVALTGGTRSTALPAPTTTPCRSDGCESAHPREPDAGRGVRTREHHAQQHEPDTPDHDGTSGEAVGSRLPPLWTPEAPGRDRRLTRW